MTAVIGPASEQAAAASVGFDLRSEGDVSTARLAARALGRALELGDGIATRFATAVSEVCRNAVMHAGGGRITYELDVRGRRSTLVATVEDEGPGIADVDAVVAPRLHDPAGAGVGLSRARRLVDDLRIAPRDGGGTLVEIVRSVPPGAAARWVAAIAAAEAVDGRRSGGAGSRGRVAARTVADPPSAGAGVEDGAELAALRAELAELRVERARLAAELEETNRGVVALYAELEDQAERLRRADELKSRFLSRVSHELRTPINSIVALSRLLADRVDGPLTEGQSTQVGFIQSAAGDLSVLVNDLLDLARIEAGRVDVVPREFVLEATFGGLRGTLRPLAKPGVELRFDSASAIPPLFTDEGKLSQIVRNFVSNALKFTDRGAVTIRPSFDADLGRLRIEVADTGIGIPAEDLERIFEEFVQVAGAHQIGVRGTGLGLSVSRGLAALLGGEVGVASVVGEGSTFWVEVPAIHVPPAEPGDEPAAERRGGVVLVVDDDPTARYLARHELAADGLRILEAATGSAGLELAAGAPPDAVILDLSMPDLDGIEVLRRLRRDPATRQIPVIVHSGRQITEEERLLVDRARAVLVGKDAPPGAVAAAVRSALQSGTGADTGRSGPETIR